MFCRRHSHEECGYEKKNKFRSPQWLHFVSNKNYENSYSIYDKLITISNYPLWNSLMKDSFPKIFENYFGFDFTRKLPPRCTDVKFSNIEWAWTQGNIWNISEYFLFTVWIICLGFSISNNFHPRCFLVTFQICIE